ncbi:MAG: class I SAM-dependent methyltransferase [Candidatus Latescibacteria bacterium]|nr:class I SAM-dependent methyltransferase [Candidatus Latescibacterota bacterium]
MSVLIPWLNRVFRRPNVAGRESKEAYSRWEHHWGREFARLFMEPSGDLSGKRLLDVGCGLGGKTVAYAEAGARAVGTDLVESNAVQSREYARVAGKGIEFFVGDAAALPVRDGAFDTVVANDAMEHFSEPERALSEMVRVLRPGGAIWVFFTPHYSPLGSHLYDYVYTPWCHLLFTRAQLASGIHAVLVERGQSADTIDARVRAIMQSFDHDINHMSIRRFLNIVQSVPGVRIARLDLRPAKFGVLKPLTRVPGLRELFTGFVTCRLERVA